MNDSFKMKKRFGQNFIYDNNILSKIVNVAKIDKDSLVIEIGIGMGTLTNCLAEKAGKVLGYEIDKELEPILKKKVHSNVDIIFDDFLKRNIAEDLKNYKYNNLFVVSNLPYYITTPIIAKIIDEKIKVDEMILMMQKEVANRIVAQTSTKEYNSLTIFINYYFETKKMFDVSRNVFFPRPNVDSSVVLFSMKKELAFLNSEKLFFQLIRNAFQFKRKNLRNNLKGYDLEKISNVLKKYNFDLTSRAEQISLDIFVDLANNL